MTSRVRAVLLGTAQVDPQKLLPWLMLITAVIVDVLDVTPVQTAILTGVAAAVTVTFLWANYAAAGVMAFVGFYIWPPARTDRDVGSVMPAAPGTSRQ